MSCIGWTETIAESPFEDKPDRPEKPGGVEFYVSFPKGTSGTDAELHDPAAVFRFKLCWQTIGLF